MPRRVLSSWNGVRGHMLKVAQAAMASAALSLFCAPSIAVDMRFLEDAPVTRLNASEVEQLRAFVIKNLEQAPDGSTAEWSAPGTAFKSRITLQKTVLDGEHRCRQARIESSARDRQASGDYWFCKAGGGDWGYRIPSANAKPASK